MADGWLSALCPLLKEDSVQQKRQPDGTANITLNGTASRHPLAYALAGAADLQTLAPQKKRDYH